MNILNIELFNFIDVYLNLNVMQQKDYVKELLTFRRITKVWSVKGLILVFYTFQIRLKNLPPSLPISLYPLLTGGGETGQCMFWATRYVGTFIYAIVSSLVK